jgi:ApbE superfamily uncharacterized protein (UPF0280 family)
MPEPPTPAKARGAGPTAALLADGHRLHLRHGPIDLVIEAWGEPDEVALAYRQAAATFDGLLEALVAELALLRRPVGEVPPPIRGPVARRMVEAVWPHRAVFITPMAAVAGAVADHVLAAMCRGRRLARAYVNDGGDIALHLAPGERLTLGMVADIHHPRLDGTIALDAADPVRGVATSGWAGRSFSLGIADAVTVLARSAAAADAAATLIANAVDLDHPAIERRPAQDLDPDSDLGDRPVTVAVGALDPAAIATALARGAAAAEAMLAHGLILGAGLWLKGEFRATGAVPARAHDRGAPQKAGLP